MTDHPHADAATGCSTQPNPPGTTSRPASPPASPARRPRAPARARSEIPHPLYQFEGAEVCLFVKDHEGEGQREAKRIVAAAAGCGVTKVIGVSKLRAKYKQFEARRRLCAAFDLFLADDRILPMLPKLLGSKFFKKKKQPIPVDLSGAEWGARLRRATAATYFVRGGGTTLGVRVGRTDQSEEQVSANLLAAVRGVAAALPKKWE